MFIDGFDFAGETMVGALGVDIEGHMGMSTRIGPTVLEHYPPK